jgi:heparanase 1
MSKLREEHTRRANYCVGGEKMNILLIGTASIWGAITTAHADPKLSVDPGKMPRVGEVDERYQSYNVEMLEVTGGAFWKPYGKDDAPVAKTNSQQDGESTNAPAGMDAGMYQYRGPLDMTNRRLRKMAAGLGPAYVRVSGTWANTTYFHDSDDPAPKTPPAGFSGVLTRLQWKGVIDFSHATDAEIVTSFATSPGTRDAAGIWTPVEAKKVLAYTQAVGGKIAAAEFMNEPTYAVMGGAPKGYDATAYGRDLAVFRPYVKQAASSMIVLGPGSVGEGGPVPLMMGNVLNSEDLLKAASPVFDVFSYHYYGAASIRCKSAMPQGMTTADVALSEDWLSRTGMVEAFYARLRDKFESGKPLWITETAESACGGNPWASTFRDTFRYVDQLGRLATLGVKVIMHNTLDASDYALLDENTYEPRPNYWGALLWRRFMGTTVLNAGPSPLSTLHLYAHSLRGVPGGVALLVINIDQAAPASLNVANGSERYTLTANDLSAKVVQLNGSDLQLGPDDALPALKGTPTQAGQLTFPPASITFLAVHDAGNTSTR